MKQLKLFFFTFVLSILFLGRVWSDVYTDPSEEYAELFENGIYTSAEYYKDPALEANQLIAGSLRSFGTSSDGDDWEGFTGDEDGADIENQNAYNDVPLGNSVYMLTFCAFLYILSKIIGKIYMKYKKKENIQV